MDGARISNAAATLGMNLKDTSKDLGVGHSVIRGTKNGLMAAEAVVIFNDSTWSNLQGNKDYNYLLRWHTSQLSSMLFFMMIYGFTNAKNANEMAIYLGRKLQVFVGGICGCGRSKLMKFL